MSFETLTLFLWSYHYALPQVGRDGGTHQVCPPRRGRATRYSLCQWAGRTDRTGSSRSLRTGSTVSQAQCREETGGHFYPLLSSPSESEVVGLVFKKWFWVLMLRQEIWESKFSLWEISLWSWRVLFRQSPPCRTRHSQLACRKQPEKNTHRSPHNDCSHLKTSETVCPHICMQIEPGKLLKLALNPECFYPELVRVRETCVVRVSLGGLSGSSGRWTQQRRAGCQVP